MFKIHLFNVSSSDFVLYISILNELVVVAKTLPDLSKISPLEASNMLSLESLVFDISLYWEPFIICSSNNFIINIIPIMYTIIVKILNLKFVCSFFIFLFNISPSLANLFRAV